MAKGNPVINLVTAQIVQLLSAPMTYLPKSVSQSIGRFIGRTAYSLTSKRVRISEENCRLAFPKKDHAEIERIVREAYSNFGLLVSESFRFTNLVKTRPGDSGLAAIDEYLLIEGWDNIAQAGAKGKGVICPTAHFGNFELANLTLPLSGYKTSSVIREVDNPYLDRFVDAKRNIAGLNVIKKDNSINEIIHRLRDNEIVTLAIDQHAGGNSVFVKFFGEWASTVSSAAVAALRTGSPVIPVYSYRVKEMDMIKVIIMPEVPLIRTGDIKTDVWLNTARFARIQQKFITEHPEEWFWMHRKWKTKPAEKELPELRNLEAKFKEYLDDPVKPFPGQELEPPADAPKPKPKSVAPKKPIAAKPTASGAVTTDQAREPAVRQTTQTQNADSQKQV